MKILVIEDEREIRTFLKKSLEAECFIVDTAENGEAGVDLIEHNDYDLITLDYSMPKMNGLEVLQRIRKDKKKVPVLVLSVKSETTTKVDLLNAGADDYLTKPFSLDELMARVKALLRRPKDVQDDILQIDNLSLDISKHLVKRGEQEIKLAKKEFALLMYLMQNESIVLSRGMIMEHVWDMSADPFSNTIESHIMSLRKKIDLPNEKKLIHTISGRGYKLSIE
jgi:DNA-binding response OmpR family regulator